WHQGLYTSRGCPYKCPFCIHSKIQFVSRYHSPERVVTEIEEIVSKFPGQKVISIYDDLFIVSKKRLEALKNLIVSEKLNRKVSFTAMCKSNHFDEDIAIMLREMNVRFVAFGLESGDEKTLQYLKKDSSKVTENFEAINLCNKYGIESGGYFILGAPPETKESLSKTYWFINSNKPPMKFIGVLFLTPLPGTKEWDNATEKGFVDPFNENWDLYNYQNHDITEKAFSNENYTFEFLKSSYDEWFAPLFADVSKLKHSPEETKLFYLRLNEELKYLNISNEDSILEIGTYFNYTFKDLMPENNKITIFDHRNYRLDKENLEKEEQILIDKKFDYIIFNFILQIILII
ncbi:MAG: B12-binding domain-containing radical SAM protein, partial [Candidatus Sericytochromatia bacterium]